MQVQWHLRPASAAAITLPTSSSTAHLLSPLSPSIVLPTSPSPRPLSPLTPSVGASHRLLLDVGTAAHPANTLLNLGGTVTLHDAVHHVSLPVLHEVMLPERISVPDFKPSRAEIDSLVKCLSVPSFAEDIARLQRKNERQVVQVLRGLLEAGTLQSDTSLESVRHLLDDSLPSVLERALAEAAQSQGQVKLTLTLRITGGVRVRVGLMLGLRLGGVVTEGAGFVGFTFVDKPRRGKDTRLAIACTSQSSNTPSASVSLPGNL